MFPLGFMNASAQDSADMNHKDLLKFLQPGETIVFRQSYGILGTAGETRFETTRVQTEDGPRIKVTVTTESRGAVDLIHPVENRSTSTIDPETGRTLIITTEGTDGGREGRTTTVFDYEAGKIKHTDHMRPHRNGVVELPDKPVYDVMITMLKFRDWDFKVGESVEFDATFEDDFYRLRATAEKEEVIKTPVGRFKAVRISLEQLGELKGFFKKGGSMIFWISRDKNPQIVGIDFKTKYGTIHSRLSSEEIEGDE